MNNKTRNTMTLEQINEVKDIYDLYWEVLIRLHEGLEITFTEENIYPNDRFLILGRHHSSCTCRFEHRGCWVVLFNGAEPMRLEECPTTFFKSILLNL